jgi:hypothetical protein
MGLMTSLVFIRSNPLLTALFINDLDKLFEILGSEQFKEIIYHVMQGDIQVKKNKKNDILEDKEEISDSEEINDSDKNNIIELMAISGKTKEECTKAYIICNKNINNAALMLLD